MREVLWGIIVLCLLFACITDCRTCTVYNFTWWISGTAAGILLMTGSKDFTLGEAAELGAFDNHFVRCLSDFLFPDVRQGGQLCIQRLRNGRSSIRVGTERIPYSYVGGFLSFGVDSGDVSKYR